MKKVLKIKNCINVQNGIKYPQLNILKKLAHASNFSHFNMPKSKKTFPINLAEPPEPLSI